MLGDSICELRKKLEQSNVKFSFSGVFSQGLIEELKLALEQSLEFHEEVKSKISSVIFTFIEQTQNIKEYELSKRNTKEFPLIAGSGIIAIGKTDSGYYVASSNVVLKEDADKLKAKLDKITAMEEKELNNYFREVSKTEINMYDCSFGLGLIEIARKAKGNVEYGFEEINDGYCHYTLTVTI